MKLLSQLLCLFLALAFCQAAPPKLDVMFKDQPDHPRPCEQHKNSADGKPMPGAFVPQCDENGQYKPLQCHGSTGHCWCVDSRGQEKPGSRKGPGAGKVNCDIPDHPRPCEQHKNSPDGKPMLGAFVPQCDKNGQYKPLQCHGSTGHCWCVDSKGQEKPGSRKGPGAGKVNCDIPDHPRPCEQHKNSPDGKPMPGAFVPQCDENGQYKPLQCHGSTGHCWCVDSRGQEKPGSRKGPGAGQVNCEITDHPRPCEQHKNSPDGKPMLGAFVPQCDKNGQYKPLQCHGSTGHCWCVDSKGQEKPGSRKGPGAGKVNCDIPERPKTCKQHKESITTTSQDGAPIVGAFVPDCDFHGQYKPLQCHSSTGYCWCVDSTGQERPGSRKGPGMGPVNCDVPGPVDRCQEMEFDAITPDANGVTYFFKGDHMWIGFHGPSELINASYKEVDDYRHLGNIDAAFSLHQPDAKNHQHTFFFLDNKVFSYQGRNHALEKGFPKDISEVFPGVPDHLDAAVECPKGDCLRDSVIFFKGNDVFHFDTQTKNVKTSQWTHLPKCTSAMRWLNQYYCFHGHQFTKFHPWSGTVTGKYPKDARDYFMKCPNFGHVTENTERESCSQAPLDAVTSDDDKRTLAFRGDIYLQKNSERYDGWRSFPIADSFKDLQGNVTAAFSYAGQLYIIKKEQVFTYKYSGEQYQLVEGFPKPLKAELGIDGPLDAAFVCGEESSLHVIKGNKMFEIQMTSTPRVVVKDFLLPFPKVDATICSPKGIRVFLGANYVEFQSPKLLAFSRIKPLPHKTSQQMFGCGH
ncbi:hypothetical protein UPYG_G00157950 [Umbra pygmaea]|uniref:Hemopexin n=1 Tax=Umbra pygmaea TaxID=75934 RepID=A0ABD0WYN6_UMBPY